MEVVTESMEHRLKLLFFILLLQRPGLHTHTRCADECQSQLKDDAVPNTA